MYMRSYKLVKEFGEGVDRMFREMETAGCPAPEYRQNGFMVYATIRQHKDAGAVQAGQTNGGLNGGLNESQRVTLEFIRQHEGYNTKQISIGLAVPFDTIDKHIRILLKQGLIEHRGSKKTGGYYTANRN